MTIIDGDLLDLFEKDEFTVIAHGCNLKGIMGAGIARQIANTYPEVPHADWLFHKTKPLPGTMLPVPVVKKNGNVGIVVNLYTQEYPGAYAKLDYIEEAMSQMLTWASYLPYFTENLTPTVISKIGIPKIGCGIGGLEWEDVYSALTYPKRIFNTNQIVVVNYTPAIKPKEEECL